MTTFIGLQQLGDLCFDASSKDKILTAGQDSFSTAGECPNCKNANLDAMPILDAEQKGIVKIEDEAIRNLARQHDTQFVICPKCGWWGYPDNK